jgi:long-chain fatty acid transport protein
MKRIAIRAAAEFMWGGDMSVDQERGPLAGRVAGEFENTAFHFVALNLSWRF